LSMSDQPVALHIVLDRLTRMERQIGEIGGAVYADPDWLHPNYTEPQVLFPLRDLIKPGQTAFDVGANFGHLSVAMSRRAGPRGAVCAFEANPEIAKRCQTALVRGGCGNVQVISTAVYHTSRQRLRLYLSDNMVADSIARTVSDRSIEVTTLALDDFVEDTGLVPDFVKMDIEGAEFDALSGFTRTVEKHRPMMILEQQPDDDRCFRLLREQGYAALELRTYRPIENFSDMPAGIVVSDILYAPPERLAGTPYAGPIAKVLELELGRGAFDWSSERKYEMLQPIDLQVGRYIVEVEFSAESDAELKCGVAMGAVPIMQYHGRADWLSRLARDWVASVEAAGKVSLFFDFPQQPDPTLRVTSARILRLPGFNGHAPLFT
jgi:FkbM family methyltransferase